MNDFNDKTKSYTSVDQHHISDPLVSVIVITYNSGNFVTETLNSIKSQTYRNIELIITDDCSTDNTIEECRKWIAENYRRFIKCDIITVEKNSGIPANCNRGLYKSKGIWIKYIGGDDLLTEDCIEKNIDFVQHTGHQVIFSKKSNFTGDFANKNIISVSQPSLFNNPALSSEDQYRLLLRGIGCPPNTMFIKREALIGVGGYDEEFPLFEDWPMNVKLTKAGYKIGFMDEVTFYYRIHSDSVYHINSDEVIYRDFEIYSYQPAYLKYAFPYLDRDERILYRYKTGIVRLFYTTKLNKAFLINRILNYILNLPFYLHRRFKIARIKKSILKRIGEKPPLPAVNK